MLPVTPKRLVVAMHRVDFRKSWNGLLRECKQMGFDPYDGDCVVFIKRDKRQIRALLGDSLGLIMVSRRFDGGPLPFCWLTDATPEPEAISAAQLTLLLEGARCEVHKRVDAWKKNT
jgi:hypothetical protein